MAALGLGAGGGEEVVRVALGTHGGAARPRRGTSASAPLLMCDAPCMASRTRTAGKEGQDVRRRHRVL